MKASLHCGRSGSASHNDRTFDLALAGHIDQERTEDNLTYCIYGGNMTFEEAELRYYKENFGKSLELQNEKYRADRHPERIRTMEQVLNNKIKQPDETLLQIGNVHNDVDTDKFASAVNDYVDWFNEKFCNNMAILDASIHLDEASPHAHIRTVAWYTDANNIKHIGQEKALEQLGYELPNHGQKASRYNNRKIAFTSECRDKWYDIAESYGFTIDRTPNPKKPKHKSTKEYIRQQEKELAEREEKISIRESRLAYKEQYADKVLQQALQARKDALDLLGDVKDQKAKEGLKMASEGVRKEIETVRRALPNTGLYPKERVQPKNSFSLGD